MSSTFTKNNKELAGAKVVSSKEVFEKKNGKYKIRADVDIIGKVDTSMSNLIMKVSRNGGNPDFVEDVCELPKRAKKELVGHFYDKKGKRNKNKVAYIIRTDRKSKGKNKKK